MRIYLYQGLFYVFLFLATAIRPYQDPVLQIHEIGFFAFYVIIATIINEWLIPRFYNQGKTWSFWGGITILMIVTFFVEEMVLEPLLVGGRRADQISNVFITLLGIIPTIFMMVGFKFILETEKKRRELENVRTLLHEGEMRFLKMQIHPHFLFNNLNNIYAHALENSSKTPELILGLSSVLRYMLYDCKDEYVPLSKEMEHLKAFLELNEMQVEGRGEVTFNLEGNPAGYRVAPLLLSVFIENAFKHSVSSQEKDIKIDINLQIDSTGKLKFKCVNTFSGSANNEDLGKGIGLENVKKRLELLYKDRYDLRLNASKDLYQVELELDLD